MPHRAASPALSENEYDISKALLDQAAGSTDDEAPRSSKKITPARPGKHLDVGAGDILDLGAGHAAEQGDDEDFILAQQTAANRKASNIKGRSVKKGGGFQAMGLNAALLKAIARKGYSVPTPIQRKTIPLVLDGQDVVGMARTGSGKTAAFVVPMLQKLKAHSARVGARALILSPSRELALQTLKVVKELGRGTDLRCILLVGGDSLEEQFASLASNPDVVIATPGRFLHLQVEMSLDLSSVRYVVFDEADRLFEMGFAAQLTEILHALPTSRQTLLFSATLPKSLVEFARAGLQEPSLVRLDAESKVSPDLESAFFTVKSAEKEGALLHILNDVIKVPTGAPKPAEGRDVGKKRKRGADTPNPKDSPTAHSTIVFAATKHHVDYLTALLRRAGFAVSYAYGALDQVARRTQVQDFRSGVTNILIVTDVAARGIDIPVLANVINYDFPAQPKIFVHRVGRTARAGRRGWSYSILRDTDAPYLIDLQLFLGRKLVLGRDGSSAVDFAQDVVVGGLVRDKLERSCESVTKFVDEDAELEALCRVAAKGEKLYVRTRSSASGESAKRAKEVVASKDWLAVNELFTDHTNTLEIEREKMLARVSGFRPLETVFEIGKRGHGGEAAEVMRKRRERIGSKRACKPETQQTKPEAAIRELEAEVDSASEDVDSGGVHELGQSALSESEDDLEVTLSQMKTPKAGKRATDWKDEEHFMAYTPASTNVAEERGYGVHSGSYNTASQNSNFLQAARGVTMDLNNDDGAKAFAEPSKARGMRWDKKSKKYVARANDEDGSKGAKYIRGESGQKIAASFRSGRFDAWRKSNKMDRFPRTGEAESTTAGRAMAVGARYKHRQEKAPKDADRFRDDYHTRKKRVAEAKEKRVGRFREGAGKREVRSVDDLRKQRALKGKRMEKNARPSKRRK